MCLLQPQAGAVVPETHAESVGLQEGREAGFSPGLISDFVGSEASHHSFPGSPSTGDSRFHSYDCRGFAG